MYEFLTIKVLKIPMDICQKFIILVTESLNRSNIFANILFKSGVPANDLLED